MTKNSKTKKSRILELLGSGNYDAQEIARLVDTSVENVYKEKSRFLKQTGKGARFKTTDDGSTKQSSSDNPESRREEIGRVERNDHLSISVLDAEGLKTLYHYFLSGYTPTSIIAQHGFPPEAVEIEYRRFCRMTNQTHANLIARIVNELVTGKNPEILSLKEKYKKTGSLNNEEIVSLLLLEKSDITRRVLWYFLSIASNASLPPPMGFVRPLCIGCLAPMGEILIVEGSDAEKNMEMNKILFLCADHVRKWMNGNQPNPSKSPTPSNSNLPKGTT